MTKKKIRKLKLTASQIELKKVYLKVCDSLLDLDILLENMETKNSTLRKLEKSLKLTAWNEIYNHRSKLQYIRLSLHTELISIKLNKENIKFSIDLVMDNIQNEIAIKLKKYRKWRATLTDDFNKMEGK